MIFMWGALSVAHRVDYDVDSKLIGRQAVLDGITRVVDPFPRVAQIAVTREESHHPSVLVFNTHIVRNDPPFSGSIASAPGVRSEERRVGKEGECWWLRVREK